MERWKKRSVELLSSLAFGSEGSPSVVPYYPQKTEVYGHEERSFLRNVPERHGISSKRIYNLLCELEGEMRANIHNLLIMVDGEVLNEGYGKEVIQHYTRGNADEPITLGEDEYFVLGDNRNHSSDSRYPSVGNIKREEILGRALVRLWPLNKIGLVD